MAKAKKLPSDNWRCQAYDYTDGAGKRHYKSFTAKTKREAEHLAAEYADTKEEKPEILKVTVETAIDNYIEIKSNVLSPSTLRRSEICGLAGEDISGNVIHVHSAVVMDDSGKWSSDGVLYCTPNRFTGIHFSQPTVADRRCHFFCIQQASATNGCVLNLMAL